MTSYCCWVRSEIELLSGGRLATFFSHPFLSKQERLAHFSLSNPSHLLTLTREGGHTFPAALSLPQTLVHINMNKRSSPLKARKNNAKPSAKPSAAPLPRRHVSDLADCEDCSATIAEGISSRSSPRRRLRTRARARARALRPRRATARGRQRRDFALRGARTRAIVG